MAIVSFKNQVQPIINAPYAAYRPIFFQPAIHITQVIPDPVVFCDVYISGNYYKTLSSTTPVRDSLYSTWYWKFDIQIVLQEYLRSNLIGQATSAILATWGDALGGPGASAAKCYCKFRGSTIDGNGFIAPEGIAGIDGYKSNEFIVLNATITHDWASDDVQNMYNHLRSFAPYYVSGSMPQLLPLTHRVSDLVCHQDYDHYPFIWLPDAVSWPPFNAGMRLVATLKDGSTITAQTGLIFPLTQFLPFYLPTGLSQLASNLWYDTTFITPLLATVPWEDIIEYQVGVVYYDTGAAAGIVCLITPKLKTIGCSCSKDRIRIVFQNYLGYWDSINFSETEVSLLTSSGEWQKPLKYPLGITDTGHNRMNVRSNQEYKISTSAYGEKHQEWLQELFNSPRAYLFYPNKNSTTRKSREDRIPIIIKDGEFVLRKVEDRYEYITELIFQFSNEIIRQRN